MQLVQFYSHQNGFEWLMHHKAALWDEVRNAIGQVDAEACRTKKSEETTKAGEMLYSPVDLNKRFSEIFFPLGWQPRQTVNWLSEDTAVLRQLVKLQPVEQREFLRKAGREPLRTKNQTDFVKDRVALELQLGKYSFVAHDLFVKHMSFFLNDDIDLGIEVVPMKSMERHMSTGVPYYERDLFNLIRQGRGVPAVPLILVGIAP